MQHLFAYLTAVQDIYAPFLNLQSASVYSKCVGGGGGECNVVQKFQVKRDVVYHDHYLVSIKPLSTPLVLKSTLTQPGLKCHLHSNLALVHNPNP